jgi:antitoxin ParD1/3/4
MQTAAFILELPRWPGPWYETVILEIAMPNAAKRTFSLPSEHAAFIDQKVASGAYASGSEVVRAGLRALQERDAAVERWLREDVAPVYDAVKAKPGRTIKAAKAFDRIRRRHADKTGSDH